MDLLAVVAAAHEISMRAEDRIGPLLALHRLTPPTAHALWSIDPSEPPPSMKLMADRLYCNAPNLTFLVNQLVDRGLVTRATDPSDRRSRVLTLTSRGREVREELVSTMLQVTPFAVLDPSELSQLAALLTRVTDASAG
ncbi:MarR family winged helix-turn-helix transcriptional regulator [Catenuloplanes japonicus]|uniref:MarR family winged helix-turn-helix transcriptional regulator n=1 Tax=Catenuloplanes japonicus TaxID=33876 RepID=UPI000526E88B|nr:MarR family transcriptional regulator [Catenuloplanes japonicus]